MFACIYIPDLPVEAIVRAEPDLRERAIIVLDGAPPLTRVISLNEPARQAGVEAGMTALQVEAAPDVVLRRRSPAQESAAHAALLDCACAFSPRVEDTAPDTILLDLAGLERLFGPAPAIGRDLARRISEVGLESHVAVASNPDAAVHAARGFPGVTVIPDGHEAERLGSLPIDLLASTPEVLETMDRWGMRSFHAFAVLPEIAVAERLGQAGIELQKLARGAARRQLVPIEPPLVFEEAVELEHPIDLLEPLAFLLNRMLEQLCSRLQSRALATNELRLRLALDISSAAVAEDGTTSAPDPDFERALKLPIPMHDPKVLLKLVQLDLKAHPPGAPVVKVWLTAEPVKPRSTQSGMFVPSAPDPERLEITLARLAGIVGEGRVGSPQILDAHRPDAFRMQHFTGAPAVRGWPTLSPVVGEGWEKTKNTTPLALRLFRPALRAAVELSSGRPVRIAFDGARLQVLSASGPWRTSGEWWSDDAAVAPGKLGTSEKDYGWNRDEWDIAVLARPPAADDTPGLAAVTERITLLRIYFDRKSDLWFVEGSYD